MLAYHMKFNLTKTYFNFTKTHNIGYQPIAPAVALCMLSNLSFKLLRQ